MMTLYKFFSLFFLITLLATAAVSLKMVNPSTMKICENQTTFGNNKIHLGYWYGVRGRVNLIRMILEFSDLDYASHYFGSPNGDMYDFSDWYGNAKPLIKLETGETVSLPWLVDCSNGKTKFVYEVGPILTYLLIKYNPKLLGSGDNKAKIVEILEKSQLVLSQIMEVATKSDLATEDALSTSESILSSLRDLEGLAADYMSLSASFLFGEVTMADFIVFEMITQLNLLAPGLTNQFVFLLQSAAAVSSLAFMRNFMNSSRYTNYPVWPKVIEKYQLHAEINAYGDYHDEIAKFGKFLFWTGASLTASTSAMCLSHPVYIIGKSSMTFRVGTLLKYRNIYHAGLKVHSKCPVTRFFRRVTRYAPSTKKDMLRECKLAMYGLLYSGTLLTANLISDICSSYVMCIASRMKTRSAVAEMILAKEGIQRKACGDTCTLRAEMMFVGRFNEPEKLVKAMRLFRISGEATVGGSVLPIVVITVINKMVGNGSLNLSGYLSDLSLALATCEETFLTHTRGRLYSDGWDRSTLCRAVIANFDCPSVRGVDDDIAMRNAQLLASFGEVSSDAFYCHSKCEASSCSCTSSSHSEDEDVSVIFRKEDITFANYLSCRSNPANWRNIEKCDKFNPAFAHIFGQDEMDLIPSTALGREFYYNSAVCV